MITPHIRWMIRRDMDEVFAIEQMSFEYPWSEDDFIKVLRARNVIGMVAEYDDTVIGYMVYELHKTHLSLLNFAVHPFYSFQGIGTAMINKLKGKFSGQRRKYLDLMVIETNLGAQLFFKKLGFEAINIERQPYDNNDYDGYVMKWHCEVPALAEV